MIGDGKAVPLLLLLALLTACQSPALVFSGGALSGPIINADSFAFAAQYKLLQLEVRPGDPYSVNLRVSMYNDHLYIDAASSRRWHKYLKQNNHVRVKLGDSVYPATAERVDDPEIANLFPSERTIYRLVPRRTQGARDPSQGDSE